MKKETITRDITELERNTNRAILKALVTTGLGNVAPLLSLARVVDSQSSVGLTCTTRVENINLVDRKSYIALRIGISTEMFGNQINEKENSVIYTFRNITSSIFEPFVFIGKNKEVQHVFAYVDDNQFLMETMEGDEETVLKTIYCEAIKKKMNVLARYVDLLLDK